MRRPGLSTILIAVNIGLMGIAAICAAIASQRLLGGTGDDRALARLGLVAAVVVAAASLTVALIGRRLGRSLRELTLASARIGGGDLLTADAVREPVGWRLRQCAGACYG